MGMDVAREGDTACTLRESRVEVRVYPSLGESWVAVKGTVILSF